MGAAGSAAGFVKDSEQVVGNFGMLEHFGMWRGDENARRARELVAFAVGGNLGLHLCGYFGDNLENDFAADSGSSEESFHFL